MSCGGTLSLKRTLDFDPIHSRRSVKRPRCGISNITTPHAERTAPPSAFAGVAPKINSEQVMARLTAHIRRMQHRRRGLFRGSSPPHSGHNTGASSPSQSSTSMSASSPVAVAPAVLLAASATGASLNRDKPLLTLQQVKLVCERMMKEREDQLRDEYDQALKDKLEEQYAAFLLFNQDQLNRRYGETASSYVS